MPLRKDFDLLEILHENDLSKVYKAVRLRDQKKVVLKLLKSSARNDATLASFSNEELLLSAFSSEKVVKLIDVIITPTDYIHVFEDIDAISLSNILLHGELSITEALDISIQMVKALEYIHSKGVIHLDINPKNIIYNQNKKILQFIDFGHSITIQRLEQNSSSENLKSANLFYMAPEQSGRTNNQISFSSDFYSLGMSLYHLFLGKAPFDSKDKYELIHKQIAFTPSNLHQVKESVPIAISQIISKLIEKTPQQRYQSIEAILYDLKFCMRSWAKYGNIKDFIIGTRDRPDIKIGEQLFGREKELRVLEDVSDCIVNSRPVRLMISGPSGVGKTRLIEELFLSLSGDKNYIIRGKFDQFNRLPYLSFKQIFIQLTTLLKSRNKQKRSLPLSGKNRAVLHFMFPELRDLLQINNSENAILTGDIQEQLILAMKALFEHIASKEHPLIIYMDDLQWADQASLLLLKESIIDANNPDVHFLSSFRDNEIDNNERASSLIDGIINESYQRYYYVKLQPLTKGEITSMLKDVLEDSRESITKLAEVVYKKTAGNPFYVKNFLDYLIDEDALKYEKGHWVFDLKKIQGFSASVNIAEIINAKLKGLEQKSQWYLEYLAVFGYSFKFQQCSQAMESFGFPTEIIDEIIKTGFIELIGDYYQFVHDQIQQNILLAINPQKKQKIHRQIGEYLNKSKEVKSSTDIITISHHLQNAYDTKKLPKKLFKLNILTLEALVFNYDHKAALEKLLWVEKYQYEEELWKNQRAHCYAYFVIKVKIFYLSGEHKEALKALETLKKHANTVDEDILCFSLFKNICVTQGQSFQKLLEYGNEVLAKLGVIVPLGDDGIMSANKKLNQKIKKNILYENPLDILKLTPLKNKKQTKIAKLLTDYWEASYYLANVSVMQWSTLMIVDASFKYGNSVQSALNYVLYGSQLVYEKSYKKAHLFGEVALKLNALQGDEIMLPKVHNFVANFINPYSQKMYKNVNLYAKSLHQSKINSDIVFGTWANFLMHLSFFFSGKPLDTLRTNINNESHFILESGDSKMIAVFNILDDAVYDIQGFEKEHQEKEQESLNLWKQEKFFPALAWYGIIKAQNALLSGLFSLGLKYLDEFVLSESNDVIMFPKIRMHFVRILLLLGKKKTLSKKEQETLASDLEEFEAYVKQSPKVFRFEKLIIEVEQLKRTKAVWDVAKLYDAAIKEARKDDNAFFLALAGLLAGRFWRDLHYDELALFYLRESVIALNHWGAYALAKEVKLLVSEGKVEVLQALTGSSTTTMLPQDDVNTQTLFKAFSAISKSQNNQELITSLMKAILENAVASRAFLLFEEKNSFMIRAGVDFQENSLKFYQENLNETNLLASEIVSFAINDGQKIIVANPYESGAFQFNNYIKEKRPALCVAIPMKLEGKIKGVLYLENRDLVTNFNDEMYRTLELLLTQAAIVFKNTNLLETLKKSERNLNKAQEISHVGGWQFNDADEKLVWSAETYRIYDLEPFSIEIDFAWFLEHLPKTEVEYVTQAANKALSGEAYYDVTHRIITAKQRIKTVHQRAEVTSDGSVKIMSGTIQDITEIKKSEELIAKLSQVVDQNPFTTIITNDKGIIEYINNVTTEMTGYKPEELIGRGMNTFRSGIHSRSFYEDLWKTISIDKLVWRGTVVNVMKNGEKRDCLSTIFPIFNRDKEITNFVTVQEDITEKLQQDKLFLMQTRQAQMGEMLSMIAHQWRQPLSIIGTLTNKERVKMILNKSNNDDVLKSYDAIELQIKHLSRTITDFRDFFKPDKERVQTKSSTIISKSLQLVEHTFSNLNIAVDVEILEDFPYFTFEHEVQQVILNLFKNAQDAIIERKIENPKLKVTVGTLDDDAFIYISDNAKGIDEDVIDSIFLPYISTKSEQNGTGLGLYMSKTIIEEHCKGSLTAKNTGDGALFMIKIPLKDSDE